MKYCGYIVAGLLLLLITSCGGGGDLTSVASPLVNVQRQANLTRETLSGTWKGEIITPDGVGRQPILLVFSQSSGFSLDGSILVGENIHIGGAVTRDTFALANGVFDKGQVRFNLSEAAGGPLILAAGNPVLFTANLSENGFMSGDVKASSLLIGFWEAFLQTQALLSAIWIQVP